MKFYTSYFYQIRFFPHNLIPLSTAVWPPKYQLKDSSGQLAIVVQCPPFTPGAQCAGLCQGKCEPKHPQDCKFLQTYRAQLDNEITEDFFQTLNKLHDDICRGEGFDDVDFAFIVYEAPNNPCSERQVIQQWFKDHHILIEEWHKASCK